MLYNGIYLIVIPYYVRENELENFILEEINEYKSRTNNKL